MLFDRKKNTKRNIIWGIISRTIFLFLPFASRTLIIYRLGINYVGLSSLFSSLLTTFSLAELGFGVAIVTIMYKSASLNDIKTLCSLLRVIKYAYLFVGFVILIFGSLCIPFLKYFINDYKSIPHNINIYILFMLFLLNSVFSYWFGSYRSCIFEIYQRQDIISRINCIVYFFVFIFQVLFLLITNNYYIYVILMIFNTVITNILLYLKAKKKYPLVVPKGKLKKEEKKSLFKTISGSFYARLGSVLSVSFDNLVVSTFLGVVVLGYYSNYAYIITTLQGFLMIIYGSMQSSIGNSITTESTEKNFSDLMKFTYLFNWLVCWTTTCLFYLINPFIKIWIGENGVLPIVVVIFLTIYYYVTICCGVQGTYKAAAGIWWEDRHRCLIGGLVNLLINILLVICLKPLGEQYALCGVIVSTIISYVFIQIPWSISITFKKLFLTGCKNYCLHLIYYGLATVITILITAPLMWIISKSFDLFLIEIILKLLVLLIWPNIIYMLLTFKDKNFIEAKKFIIDMLRR